MKRTLVVFYFVILLVTLYWFFSIPEQSNGHGFAKSDLAETQTAVLAQVWNLLRFSPFTNDVSAYFANKVNLSAFGGFAFMNCKQGLPVWGKTQGNRSVSNVFWSLFALMIISLFYCFYFCSKADSEAICFFDNIFRNRFESILLIK